MAKFIYAACYYPDSLNEVCSVEAEDIEEAKTKIMNEFRENYGEDLDTDDWFDFLEILDQVFEVILSEVTNVENL